MGKRSRLINLSEVNAVETPPVPLSTHDVMALRNMVGQVQRRSARKAEANRASGFDQELPGEDADAIRAEVMGELHAKLEAWLEVSWPRVDQADQERRDSLAAQQ